MQNFAFENVKPNKNTWSKIPAPNPFPRYSLPVLLSNILLDNEWILDNFICPIPNLSKYINYNKNLSHKIVDVL